MTFSAGWIAEAQKPFGESLSLRVYVREPGGDNWFTTQNTATLNANNFDNPSLEAPTSAATFLLAQTTTASTGYLVYTLPEDIPVVSGSEIVTSLYVYSGSTSGTNVSDQLKTNLVEVTRAYNILGRATGFTFTDHAVYWDNNGVAGFSSASTVGQVTGASEVLTGFPGWTRIWMKAPVTDLDALWEFQLSPDESLTTLGVAQYSSIMIQVDTDPPGEFLENVGQTFQNIPGTLRAISDDSTSISINPIETVRERYFGVSQGQKTVIRISNSDFIDTSIDLQGAWCAVQAGFVDADIWETVAQGRIVNAVADTDLNLTLELDDGVMEVINSEISRDMKFTSTGWISDVERVDIDTGSTRWNSDSGVTEVYAPNAANIQDERFEIVFEDDDQFKIYRENGLPVAYSFDDTGALDVFSGAGVLFSASTAATYTARFGSTSAPDEWALTISGTGWGTGYTPGDTFEVFTSAPRSTDELSPMGMVAHLIEDVVGVRVFDVMNGEYYSSPLFDTENWTNLITGSSNNGRRLGGYWRNGSRVIQMVQDALKLEVGAIYPTNTGQIAGWYPIGLSSGSTALNGRPGNAAVTILSAEREVSLDDYANKITYEYVDLESEEDTSFTVESTFNSLLDRHKTIKTRWGSDRGTVRTAADKANIRFSVPREIFRVSATLDVAGLTISDPISITEPFLNATSERVDVVEKAIDVQGQRISLEAWTDPLTQIAVFLIDGQLVGDSESVLDSTTRKVY